MVGDCGVLSVSVARSVLLGRPAPLGLASQDAAPSKAVSTVGGTWLALHRSIIFCFWWS